MQSDLLPVRCEFAQRPGFHPHTPGYRACRICGRQDATLRLVAYPYVFSLLLLTFRRASRVSFWPMCSLRMATTGIHARRTSF